MRHDARDRAGKMRMGGADATVAAPRRLAAHASIPFCNIEH
jgi:hypothetical protein